MQRELRLPSLTFVGGRILSQSLLMPRARALKSRAGVPMRQRKESGFLIFNSLLASSASPRTGREPRISRILGTVKPSWALSRSAPTLSKPYLGIVPRPCLGLVSVRKGYVRLPSGACLPEIRSRSAQNRSRVTSAERFQELQGEALEGKGELTVEHGPVWCHTILPRGLLE